MQTPLGELISSRQPPGLFGGDFGHLLDGFDQQGEGGSTFSVLMARGLRLRKTDVAEIMTSFLALPANGTIRGHRSACANSASARRVGDHPGMGGSAALLSNSSRSFSRSKSSGARPAMNMLKRRSRSTASERVGR